MVERLWFGLAPDETVIPQIVAAREEFQRIERIGGQPVRPDRLHLTLNCVGDHAELPSDIVEIARHAAGQVRFPPFEVSLDRIGSYTGAGSPGDLITLQGDAGVVGVVRLQRALADQMHKAGLGRFVRRTWFTPHMSLLYGARPATQRLIRPIRWTARELVLVHSEVGRTRHNSLGEWALQA